jgi:hypothetical protein
VYSRNPEAWLSCWLARRCCSLLLLLVQQPQQHSRRLWCCWGVTVCLIWVADLAVCRAGWLVGVAYMLMMQTDRAWVAQLRFVYCDVCFKCVYNADT